jgi:hypothetical protein
VVDHPLILEETTIIKTETLTVATTTTTTTALFVLAAEEVVQGMAKVVHPRRMDVAMAVVALLLRRLPLRLDPEEVADHPLRIVVGAMWI